MKSHASKFKETVPDAHQSTIDAVNNMYLRAVMYNVVNHFGDKDNDPFLAKTRPEFEKRTKKWRQQLKSATDRKDPKIQISEYIKKRFPTSSQIEQRRIISMLEFDCQNAQMQWFHCDSCMGRFLQKKPKKNQKYCTICSKGKDGCKKKNKDLLKDNYLPIWRDADKKIHYDVPTELQHLTLGEKLLIQKYSAILPLVHIYKGRLGNRGNSVSFNKDLDKTCTELPRSKADIIIIVKTYIDGRTSTLKSQQFKIRRKKVLNALYWLKDHHPGYKDITINEGNLDWVGDKGVAYLDKDQVRGYESQSFSPETSQGESETVAKSQTEIVMEQDEQDDDLICHNGITTQKNDDVGNDSEKAILSEIRDAAKERSDMDIDTMDFPHISDTPINEFEEPLLFANSYPWLFPGGLGDKSQSFCGKNKDIDVKLWIQILMRWHDGRFMRDDMFSFHLHNFRQRQMNNTSGLVFVKHFINDSKITVDQIKEQISSGDKTFISKIQYFAGSKIRGSDPFWRSVKHEVDEWISYHLDRGDGPPTLFLTFSCAEYWWQELEKLLHERCQGTEDESTANEMMHADTCDKRKMTLKSILVEKYSAVVQEFFQIRMDNWLKTVGKDVFGMNHYWMRFEFAKGRGTIHAHILGITSESYIVQQFYDAHTREEKTEVMANYARNTLDMSAEKPEEPELEDGIQKPNPLSFPYCQVVNDNEDKARLVEGVHMHECGKFCLRYPRLG